MALSDDAKRKTVGTFNGVETPHRTEVARASVGVASPVVPMTRGEYMKSKYRNEDPDVCANDYGPPQRNNGATWDDFHDGELERLRLMDKDTPL